MRAPTEHVTQSTPCCVQQPLIIHRAWPLVLAPGDTVDCSVRLLSLRGKGRCRQQTRNGHRGVISFACSLRTARRRAAQFAAGITGNTHSVLGVTAIKRSHVCDRGISPGHLGTRLHSAHPVSLVPALLSSVQDGSVNSDSKQVRASAQDVQRLQEAPREC